MKFTQLDVERYFSTPNPSLRVYFSRVETGYDQDVRTPLWNGESRDSIMNKGQSKFDDLMNAFDSEPGLESLVAFELDLKSKVGPMSIQNPLEDRIASIEDYGKLSQYTFPLDKIQAGIDAVVKEFTPLKGVRLAKPSKVVSEMKLNTNSGTPYFTKRRNVLDKELSLANRCFGNPEQTEKAVNTMAAVLGGRGQEGGPEPSDVKQRVIFMMPFMLNILEHTVYQPLISGIQKTSLIPAYKTMRDVEKSVTKLFDTKGKDDLVIATDFSKMDQHVNAGAQIAISAIYQQLLSRGSEATYGLKYIYPVKYNIPLIIDLNTIIEGQHGMGSGSSGTNLDESLLHRAMQYQAAINNGAILNIGSLYLGDDGILTFPGITVDKVISTYTAFGFEMNPSKQYASTTDTVYLRRGYHTQFRDKDKIMIGVYSTFRALGRLMGQERYMNPKLGNEKMIVLRSLSILENCANHPLFEQFVQFVIEGDKYRLGLSIPGFFDNLKAMYAEAKANLPSLGSYVTSELQENGISNGRVVQYLQRLQTRA